MNCIIDNTRECQMMDKPCDYGIEFDKAVDTITHTLEKYIPFCTYDSDCDKCPQLRIQCACLILGDLIDNGIKVTDTGLPERFQKSNKVLPTTNKILV